ERMSERVGHRPEAIDLDVGGMTCASCAAGIERTLGQLDGVASASVNFATSKAHVELLDPAVRAEDLVRAVESIGYRASVRKPPGQRRQAPPAIDLDVGGMTCASCAAGIERTLGQLDGVASASVNFATSKAH